MAEEWVRWVAHRDSGEQANPRLFVSQWHCIRGDRTMCGIAEPKPYPGMKNFHRQGRPNNARARCELCMRSVRKIERKERKKNDKR